MVGGPARSAARRLPRLGVDRPCVGFFVLHAAPFDGSVAPVCQPGLVLVPAPCPIHEKAHDRPHRVAPSGKPAGKRGVGRRISGTLACTGTTMRQVGRQIVGVFLAKPSFRIEFKGKWYLKRRRDLASLSRATPPRRAGSAAPAGQATRPRGERSRKRSAGRAPSPLSAPQGTCWPAAHTRTARPH